MRWLVLMVVMAVAAMGCGGLDGDLGGTDEVGQVDQEARAVPPTGKKIGTLLTAGSNPRNKIQYKDGQVMAGHSDVYFIWYGDWAGSTTPGIMDDLVLGLSGSSYFAINTRYPDFTGAAPNGGLVLGPQSSDLYSHGASLTDGDVEDVVRQQLSTGQLPVDPRGIYVVLASSDVATSSGFCTAYCGFHNQFSLSGTRITYTFIGNGERCPSACLPQTGVSPNDNPGADGMANVLANELSATVTDPSLTAYYDRDGFEAPDKCAWTFGTTYTASNGAQANVRLGTRDFLLQRNWVPTKRGGVCAMDLQSAAAAIAAGEDIIP